MNGHASPLLVPDEWSVAEVLIELVLAHFVGAILGIFICWLTVMVHFALFLCDRWARPCGGRFVDYLQTCLLLASALEYTHAPVESFNYKEAVGISDVQKNMVKVYRWSEVLSTQQL